MGRRLPFHVEGKTKNINMKKIFVCFDRYDLFYSTDEATDATRGCIGHLRGDFGKNGKEFHWTWFDHQPRLKTKTFQRALESMINALRKHLLKSRESMHRICSVMPESKNNDWYFFMRITASYEYYIKCFPSFGDYNFYVYCYNKKIKNKGECK